MVMVAGARAYVGPVEIAVMYNVSKRPRAVACSYRGEIQQTACSSNTLKLFLKATCRKDLLPLILKSL